MANGAHAHTLHPTACTPHQGEMNTNHRRARFYVLRKEKGKEGRVWAAGRGGVRGKYPPRKATEEQGHPHPARAWRGRGRRLGGNSVEGHRSFVPRKRPECSRLSATGVRAWPFRGRCRARGRPRPRRLPPRPRPAPPAPGPAPPRSNPAHVPDLVSMGRGAPGPCAPRR